MADASSTIYRQVFFSFSFSFLVINGVFRYYWNFNILNDNERPELLPSMQDRMKKAFTECYWAVQPILGCDDGSAGNDRRHSELFWELRYVHSSGQSTCWMLIISHFLGISQPHSTGSILRKRTNNSYHKTVLQFRDGYYRLIINNAPKYNLLSYLSMPRRSINT